MKQPYRFLVGSFIFVAFPVLVTYLTVTVYAGFAIGYILWGVLFGLLLNDFHAFDF